MTLRKVLTHLIQTKRAKALRPPTQAEPKAVWQSKMAT
jgi:hypothetical protein